MKFNKEFRDRTYIRTQEFEDTTRGN